MPYTLAVLEPHAFDVPCRCAAELAVYSLGWLLGRDRWGLC